MDEEFLYVDFMRKEFKIHLKPGIPTGHSPDFPLSELTKVFFTSIMIQECIEDERGGLGKFRQTDDGISKYFQYIYVYIPKFLPHDVTNQK